MTWKRQWLGFVGILCLIGMTWLPMSYFRMVGWPWIVLWQVGFIAIGACIFSMLRQFKQSFQPLGYGLDWIVGLLLIVLSLSSGFSSFPAVAAWNLCLVLGYILLVYMLRNWLREKALTHLNLWLAISLVGIITSLISLAYWQPNSAMWVSNDFDDAIRNAMPLGHHNFTGGYLVLVLPVIASYTLTQRQKKYGRWIWGLATLLTALALYASGSRGAWLGISVTVLVALGLSVWHSQGRHRRKLLVVALISVVLLGGIFFSNPRIRGLTSDVVNSLSSGQQSDFSLVDNPSLDRYFMAQAAMNMIKDRPLLGVGPGNMSRVYTLYRPIEAGAGLTLVQQLHNMPLQLLGELGLVGFGIYLSFVFWLIHLALKLSRIIQSPTDKMLLYGVSASLLAYSLSSLTDSQLENIGISFTLTILILILIGLADRYLGPEDLSLSALSSPVRRFLSLAVIAYLGFSLRFWLPMDRALLLSHEAIEATRQIQFTLADSKWNQAANLVPWDPTYNGILAQQVIDISKSLDNLADRKTLTERAIFHTLASLEMAPNDPDINRNLANLYLDLRRASQAEIYAARAVQLLPRTINTYSYDALGLAYLQQGKRQQAITAFELEILGNPSFATAIAWNELPLSTIRQAVMEQTALDYQQLRNELQPNHPYYQALYQNEVLLRWWHNLSLPTEVENNLLSPIANIFLAVEQSPKIASQTLNQSLANDPENENLNLIRTWLLPERYLKSYLQTSGLSLQDQELFQDSIQKYRRIRDWLGSVPQVRTYEGRGILAFTYRNLEANRAYMLLVPNNTANSLLANTFGLFRDPPRELPQLDQLMEQLRAEKLNLPHPTHYHFQVSTLIPKD